MSTQAEAGPALAEAAIGLGGNLGDPCDVFDRALRMMPALDLHVVRRSALYRSRAWGYEAQPDFTNAAVLVRTQLGPRAVLERLMRIERTLGRRRLIHWGPRTLDLDLLLYADAAGAWSEGSWAGLTLPHPGIAGRDFVLAPLGDLAMTVPPRYGAEDWRHLLESLPPAEHTLIERRAWELTT